MTQNISHPETQGIINTYKVIYKMFFVFGNFVLAGLLTVLGWYLISHYAKGAVVASSAGKSTLTPLSSHSLQGDFSLYAYQNTDITQSADTLTSHRNIIQYKGYTLPAHISRHNFSRLVPANIFNNETYSVGALKVVAPLLFGASSDFPSLPRARSVTSGSAMGSLQLDCLYTQRKASNAICEKMVTQKIHNLTANDISQYSQELSTIAGKLSKKLQSTLCETIIDHTRKSGQTSPSARLIIDTCGTQKQKDAYVIVEKLAKANKDLQDQQTARAIGNDQIINEYIIHSLLQKIWHGIQTNTLDKVTLKQYILTWNTILSKQYPLGSFSYDMSYYLNRNIILPYLVKYPKTKYMNLSDNASLTKDLKNLNHGTLQNNGGLKARLKNTSLLGSIVTSNETNTNEETGNGSETISFQGKYYREKTQQKDNQGNITSRGFIGYNNEELPLSIDADASGTIMSILIDNKPQWTETVNTLIQQQKLHGLQSIEGFIVRNWSRMQANRISMCDMLEQQIDDALTSCTEQLIVIDQKKNDTDIHYEISLDANKRIVRFKINNAHMKQRIKTSEIPLNTKSSTIVKVIKRIVDLPRENPSENTNTQAGNKFLVIDRMKNYLHLTPDNVGQKGKDFLIGMTIDNKKFYAKYDIATHSIRYLVLPDIKLNGKSVAVPDFVLELRDDNIHNISKFLQDPIGYVRSHHQNIDVLYGQQNQ